MSERDLTQPPLQVAARLVSSEFANCLAAFLAGSVVRDEHTPTSDLDIVIVSLEDPAAPYRRSCLRGGWPVELFVHTPDSLRRFFEMDCRDRQPSLPQMVSEGLIIYQQAPWAEELKAEAQKLLQQGPPPLSSAQIESRRYFLTDLLDDLKGSQRPEESIFIANELAEAAAQFYLDYHGHWQGHGKWLYRALKRAEPLLAQRLVEALQAVYQDRLNQPLAELVTELLSPAGGLLFDGYYSQAPAPDAEAKN